MRRPPHTTRVRTRIRFRSTLILVTCGIAASATMPLASADPLSDPLTTARPTLGVLLTLRSDGTPNFDDGAPNPDHTGGAGLDAGPRNDIVRTADTVVYRVDWSVNDADATATTVIVELDAGLVWVGTPAACLEPQPPTATTLTCRVGDLSRQIPDLNAMARVPSSEVADDDVRYRRNHALFERLHVCSVPPKWNRGLIVCARNASERSV